MKLHLFLQPHFTWQRKLLFEKNEAEGNTNNWKRKQYNENYFLTSSDADDDDSDDADDECWWILVQLGRRGMSPLGIHQRSNPTHIWKKYEN